MMETAKASAFKQGHLDDLADFPEINIVFTGKPSDRLIEKGLVRPDFLEEFREGHLPFRFQSLIDFSRCSPIP